MRNPGWTLWSRIKLRITRPAAISSMNDTATCATTSAPRMRFRWAPAVLRPPWRIPSARFLPAESAGARPNAMPVNSETASGEQQHRRVDFHFSGARGELLREFDEHGESGRRQRQAQRAAGHDDNSRLSVRCWRTSCIRVAPSAMRTASSRSILQQAREHQVRDVGAGDQQHQAGGAQQDQERGSRAAR